MSFIQFNSAPLRTKEQVAQEVYNVALKRNLDQLAAVIALMAIDTEVGADDANGVRQWWCPWNAAVVDSQSYEHDSQSDDSRSMGYFQQQPGPQGQLWWGNTQSMMTLDSAADTFLSRLSDNYSAAAGDAHALGVLVQNVQGSAFPDRYQESYDLATQVLTSALAGPQPAPAPVPAPEPEAPVSQTTYTVRAGDTLWAIAANMNVSLADLEAANPGINPNQITVGQVLNLPQAQSPTPAPQPAPEPSQGSGKPAYTEKAMWSTNFQPREGTKVDLWLLHTEEANDTAEGLANFLISTEGGSNPVSYHYTIRQNPDGSVTVCDVVDTDYASWSVMNSNDRSINLCFAGSLVAWTTDQWMQQSAAIDVAAYLCVQDCIKYGIDPKLLVDLDANGNPQYIAAPPGIADHRYCGEYLHDGNNHTDVGDNFPWPYFAQRVAAYAAPAPAPAPAPNPEPSPAPAPEPAPVPDPTPAPFVHPDTATMIQEIWDQLRGPEGAGWPQLGGLTVVDAIAKLLEN